MAETVRTRHRISGKIDEHTPIHIAEHEVLGVHLEIVDNDAKPYLPEMHKPKFDVQPEVTDEPVAPKKNSKD